MTVRDAHASVVVASAPARIALPRSRTGRGRRAERARATVSVHGGHLRRRGRPRAPRAPRHGAVAVRRGRSAHRRSQRRAGAVPRGPRLGSRSRVACGRRPRASSTSIAARRRERACPRVRPRTTSSHGPRTHRPASRSLSSWRRLLGPTSESVSVAGRRGDELGVLVDDRPLSRLAASAAELDRIELPRFDGESILVRIRGDEGFYLEPRFRFESRRTRKAGDASSIPLRIRSQRREGGRTIVELERPSGVVPEALRVTSSTPSFDRPVAVFDVGSASADRALGEGRILRAGGPGEPIEARDVRVRPAEGTGLRVEITDGSSPPLGALAFAARVRRPALLFQVPMRREGPAASLYFGGGRAVAPDYDIAALLPDPDRSLSGERAQIAARLRDDASLVRARLGEVRRNPAYDDEPALGFAMRAGAELDPRTFAHRRRLAIAASRRWSLGALSLGRRSRARPCRPRRPPDRRRSRTSMAVSARRRWHREPDRARRRAQEGRGRELGLRASARARSGPYGRAAHRPAGEVLRS